MVALAFLVQLAACVRPEAPRPRSSLLEKYWRDYFARTVGTAPTPSGSGVVHQGQWIVDNEPGRGVRSAVGLFPDSVALVLLINTNGGFTATEIITRGYSEIMPRLWSVVRRGSVSAAVRVERPSHAESVACTTNGQDPTADSPRSSPVLRVALPAVLRCRAYAGGEPVSFVRVLSLAIEATP